MRFRFDPNQECQFGAVRSVVDLSDGEPFIRVGMVFKSGSVALSAVAKRRIPDLSPPVILSAPHAREGSRRGPQSAIAATQ